MTCLLDVMKIHWNNCSTAWKGQFEGHAKFDSIGFEAVDDHNLWFWHAAFGVHETVTDINSWEHSSFI